MISYADIYMRGRHVVFLLDEDEEGKRKKARIESWKTKANRDCPVLTLGDLKPGNCSIEDFLEFSLLKESVVAACKEAIGLGVVQPKNTAFLPIRSITHVPRIGAGRSILTTRLRSRLGLCWQKALPGS
jgi:hypothetical protein